jgi:anion-transporting  ArsA/GET3 family ATPase
VTDLLERRLVFVTGKGGVGKTTISAALALLAARRGKRTLVCEVDAKGTLAATFECAPLGFVPREVQDGLFGMTMDTEDSLREYLALQLRVPLLARLGPLARMFDFVANAAPGVKEILTIGKLCYEVRERHYDFVVVDAVSTGHIVGQLTAPQAINEMLQVGLVHDQTRWMVDLMEDPAITGLVIVTTPEEMPVNETIELAGRLDTDTHVPLAAVIVNRVLPELFGRSEADVFQRLRKPPLLEELVMASGRGTPIVLDAAALAVRLRRAQATELHTLRQALGGGVPFVYVPELFARIHGMRATSQVADHLAEELET